MRHLEIDQTTSKLHQNVTRAQNFDPQENKSPTSDVMESFKLQILKKLLHDINVIRSDHIFINMIHIFWTLTIFIIFVDIFF